MKRTRLVATVLGLSIGFMLALARPARAQDALTLWHAYTGAEAEGLARAVDGFRRAHPGLSVTVLSLPFGAYSSKLEAAIGAGSGPDVFIDAHERLPVYLERGMLAALSSAPATDTFLPAHVAALSDRGKVYALPLALKCVALYVNPALAGEADVASFEALAALRGRLPRDQYPLTFEADNPYYLAAFLHGMGGELLSAQGEYGFTGVPTERTLALLRAWSKERVLPAEPSAELTKRLFVSGKAAAMIGGPWLAPDLPDSLAWRVVPLPPLTTGAAPLAPFVTIESAYLSHAPARPASRTRQAEELARYLTTGEGALARAEVGGQVVAALTLPRPVGGPHARLVEVFREAASLGKPMSVHPHMRRVWEPAQRAAKKALRGEAEIANVLAESRRRFDEAVRPLPEPRSPGAALALVGLGLGVITLAMVRRAAQPDFRRRLRASLPAYAYLAHAVVAVLLLVVLPLTIGALTSFFAGRGRDLYYVGVANYVDILTARGGELLSAGSFYVVLLVTLLWTLANLALHVSLGVVIALFLSRLTGKLSRTYRVLLILPWAVPSYVTALAWRGMFHRQFGAVNAMLEAVGVEPVSWFAQFSTAFSANLTTNTWLGFPFMMVVTLGALTSIPRDLYEAASVDGASSLDQLRMITLPMIRPVLMPAVAMGAVWTFNMFNVIFLVSGGEPDGTTEILVSEAYRWAFTRSSQYGYAAAYAVLIFGMLVVSTRVLRPWLEEKRA